METVPSWFWLGMVGLVQLCVGLSVLFYFARRALREDTDAAPRRRRRSIRRVLEFRLERLLLHPPRWEQVWLRVRPYLLGAAGLAAAGFAIWSLVNWLATPSPSSPPSTGGLATTQPFEALADHLMRSMGSFSPLISVLGILIAGSSIVMGEGRLAYLGVVMVIGATFTSFVPRAFKELSVSDSSRSQPLLAPQVPAAETSSARATSSAAVVSRDDATESVPSETAAGPEMTNGSDAAPLLEEPGPSFGPCLYFAALGGVRVERAIT